MSALTRKHPIDEVALRVIGPRENQAKAIQLLESFGFKDASGSIPWRDAFPDMSDGKLPGMCLKGARVKERFTQKELARSTGIPQRHISEIENGRRRVGKERAKKLADALHVDYRIFL